MLISLPSSSPPFFVHHPGQPAGLADPSFEMITDVQLAALSNWLGSIGMVLIVIYHFFAANQRRAEARQANVALRSR